MLQGGSSFHNDSRYAPAIKKPSSRMRKGTAMKNNQQKTKRVSPLRLIAGILLRIIAAVLIFVVALIGVLTIGEYRPADAEEIEVQAGAESPAAAQAELPTAGEPIRLVSWNIGYGALGDNADFFMDGGESVMTADKERVKEKSKDRGQQL